MDKTGNKVMLKLEGNKRKPIFIGHLVSEDSDTITVSIPTKYKRKYKNNPSILFPGGVFVFKKEGMIY
jgi:hypothetical protein